MPGVLAHVSNLCSILLNPSQQQCPRRTSMGSGLKAYLVENVREWHETYRNAAEQRVPRPDAQFAE